MASDNDHKFLIALLPAIGVFAITEDVLVFPTGPALFAYLGALLTKRSAEASPGATRPRRRRARSTVGAQPG